MSNVQCSDPIWFHPKKNFSKFFMFGQKSCVRSAVVWKVLEKYTFSKPFASFYSIFASSVWKSKVIHTKFAKTKQLNNNKDIPNSECNVRKPAIK